MGFVIKLQFENDVRRLTLEKLPAFSELLDLVRSLFESSNLPVSFFLKYKDDEGDLISVTSDRELTEAFGVMGKGILRFTVVASAPKPAPSTPNSNPNERVVEIDVGPYLDQIVDFIGQFTGRRQHAPGWAGPCGKGPCGNGPCGNGNNSNNGEAAHWGVTCDGCNVHPIRGNRHKCTQCPDYDLCDKCLEQGIHKEHTFDKITHPRRRCHGRGGWGRWHHHQHHQQAQQQQQTKEETNATEVPKEEVKVPEVVPLTPLSQPEIKEEVKALESPRETAKIPEIVPLIPLTQPRPPTPTKEPEQQPQQQQQAHPYAAQNKQLVEMGFIDQSRNLALLSQYNGDMVKAVMHLLSN